MDHDHVTKMHSEVFLREIEELSHAAAQLEVEVHRPAVGVPQGTLMRVDRVAQAARAETTVQQSALSLSLKDDDATILTALIVRTASQKRILCDLGGELPEFALPYREL